MKKRKWFLLVACLLLLLGSGWLYFLLTGRSGGSSYNLTLSTAFVSVEYIPFIVDVQVTPRLAQEGLVARELDTNYEISQMAFVRRERACLKLFVIAGKQEVDTLSYTTFGANGERLSQGKVKMEALKPGESGQGEIIDLEVANARRVVIEK